MLADLALAAPPTLPGVEVRAPRPDDLDGVTRLFAAAAAERGGSALRREDLRVRWLLLDDLRDAVLISHPDQPDLPIAYASATIEPGHTGAADTEVVVHLELQVHPAWRGRGLGAHLLHLAVHVGAGSDAPADGDDNPDTTAAAGRAVRVRGALTESDPAAETWFTAQGFRPARHLLELRLDLHAPPPSPRWPDGVTARVYRPGIDDELLWRTHQAAFADVATHLPIGRADYLDDRRPARDPGLVLFAEDHRAEHGDAAQADGPAVVGLAVCRAGTEVAAEDGWVRDLGVVPARRRQGIAMALLRTTFAAFRARGLTGVALEVDDVTLDGAVALYRRAGMRVTRRTDVLELLTRPEPLPRRR